LDRGRRGRRKREGRVRKRGRDEGMEKGKGEGCPVYMENNVSNPNVGIYGVRIFSVSEKGKMDSVMKGPANGAMPGTSAV